jgi:hypothetical protein
VKGVIIIVAAAAVVVVMMMCFSEPFIWLWADGCLRNGEAGSQLEDCTRAAQM